MELKSYRVFFKPLVMGLIVQASSPDEAEKEGRRQWDELVSAPIVTKIEEWQEKMEGENEPRK